MKSAPPWTHPREHHGEWRPFEPREAVLLLSSLSVPWWIAGGWALDLFLDQRSRPHKDLDVGVFRRDIGELRRVLVTWELFEAKDGLLALLPSDRHPRSDVHSLWGRPAGSESWSMELMLDESDGEEWSFRRHNAIKRSVSMMIRRSASGIPYLAPEIQLLYKSKALRVEDQADFDRVAPRLDATARGWLIDCLERTSPGHRWIGALGGGLTTPTAPDDA